MCVVIEPNYITHTLGCGQPVILPSAMFVMVITHSVFFFVFSIVPGAMFGGRGIGFKAQGVGFRF